MKRFLALVKVNLKTASVDYYNNLNIKRNLSPLKKVGQWVLIALLVVYLWGIVSFLSYAIVEQFINFGQPTLLLYLIMTISPVVTLYFSILSTPGIFYFSKDVKDYLILPIHPWEIVAAKFVSAYLYTLISMVFLLGPIFVIYFIKVAPGIISLLFTVLSFMTIPLIPLSIALLVVILLMRFVPFFKNKDLFMYLTFGLVFIPIFIFSFSMSSMGENPEAIQQIMESLLAMDNQAFRYINLFLPTSSWMTNGIVNQNFLPILLSILVSLGVAILVIFTSQSLYFEGVLSTSDSSSKKKRLHQGEKAKETKSQSIPKSIMVADFKTILRTPSFAINYYSAIFIVPIVSMVPLFLNGMPLNTLDGILGVSYYYHTFFDALAPLQQLSLPLSFGIAVGLFLGNMDTSANTAISREARNLKMYLTFPIKLSDMVKGKAYLSMINSVFMPSILTLAFVVLTKPKFITLVLLILGLVEGIVLITYISLFADVYSPSLNWETEQQAAKGNFKQVIVILPFMVIPLILLILSFTTSPLIMFLVLLIGAPIVIYFVVTKTYKIANTKLIETIQNMND